jgi:ABC-type glycerol-3-phosphate transport system substrate-binding protein
LWIKRIIFAVMIGIGLWFLIAGGAGPADIESAPRGYTVVEYWEKWVGNEATQMQQIVDDFNRTVGREKHIHVRYMSMSQVDQKTLVAVAGGVPPDVAGVWDAQIPQFAAYGAAEPLDDLAAAHGINADTYLPVFWNGCHYQGHLYALVSTPAAVALLYNKQIFQENADKLRAAGLDPDRAPQTLAELDRYAQILDTRETSGSNAGMIDRAGFIPLQNWYLAEIPFWFGGNIFDPAMQRFTLTSPQTIAAYQWIKSYTQRLGVRAMLDFNNGTSNFDSPQNPFLIGKVAMEQQGPWMANYIENLKPSMSAVLVPHDREKTLPDRRENYAWAFAPFPSAVPGLEDVTYCPFDALIIPRGARHPREAFEFMAYVNRQDVMEKLCTLHCKDSPLRKVSPGFVDNHPNPYIDVFQKLSASPNAHGVPPVPIWPEVAKELSDAAQAVAVNDADPQAVLSGAQQRLQEKYDRFRQIQLQRQRRGME